MIFGIWNKAEMIYNLYSQLSWKIKLTKTKLKTILKLYYTIYYKTIYYIAI